MSTKQHLKILVLALVIAAAAGCKSNLQQPYIEGNQAAYESFKIDVKEGRWKPTALKLQVLEQFGANNDKAEAAMRSEGEWVDPEPEAK